ncbi:MAG TPA: peptidoglycan-binding domain-containing protein [Stellaceae bacterium]|nr:peptidoglycan-binding domain-containing protein [Stellaceae bacterium]
MNRTLTAAVALTAALGMAGLAHAQSSTNPSTQPSTMSPSPGMTAPAGTPSPTTGATGSTTGTSATQPQANSQMNMNQGQMNQARMNQTRTGQRASRSEIQEAQQALKSQGLYMGAVDGMMGPKTQNAVVAFQREHKLPETAQLDQQTMDALNGGGSSSGMTGTQQPGAAGMRPGNSNAPVPAGSMNGAPGTPAGATNSR